MKNLDCGCVHQKDKMINKLRRQWSEPAIRPLPIVRTGDSSGDDESEYGQLDYNEDVYYGWNDFQGVRYPAPAQVRRPNPRSKRRPGDKLHLAVWDDDPAKLQKLVNSQGTTNPHDHFYVTFSRPQCVNSRQLFC